VNTRTTYDTTDRNDRESLDKLKVPFTVGADEAWNKISGRIGDVETENRVQVRKLSAPYLLTAASLALLLSVTAFLRFYQASIQSSSDPIALALPDGSSVEVKAHSHLKYHPLWWQIKRISHLEGVAFFEVKKGNTFVVKSEYGSTEVLGTSFLIDAHTSKYNVKCFTGSVKVLDSNGEVEAVLKPSEEVIIDDEGNFNIRYFEIEATPEATDEQYLSFEGVPVIEVFLVLEQAFDVDIEMYGSDQPSFSGVISRQNSLEDILAAVCIPLDLKYEKKSADHYIVSAR